MQLLFIKNVEANAYKKHTVKHYKNTHKHRQAKANKYTQANNIETIIYIYK